MLTYRNCVASILIAKLTIMVVFVAFIFISFIVRVFEVLPLSFSYNNRVRVLYRVSIRKGNGGNALNQSFRAKTTEKHVKIHEITKSIEEW
jgi:hypothetical protein